MSLYIIPDFIYSLISIISLLTFSHIYDIIYKSKYERLGTVRADWRADGWLRKLDLSKFILCEGDADDLSERYGMDAKGTRRARRHS